MNPRDEFRFDTGRGANGDFVRVVHVPSGMSRMRDTLGAAPTAVQAELLVELQAERLQEGLPLHATVELGVAGTARAWRFDETAPRRRVEFEIQGDGRSGFHLVRGPEGWFAPDSWHETLIDALETAVELGVAVELWRPSRPR